MLELVLYVTAILMLAAASILSIQRASKALELAEKRYLRMESDIESLKDVEYAFRERINRLEGNDGSADKDASRFFFGNWVDKENDS